MKVDLNPARRHKGAPQTHFPSMYPFCRTPSTSPGPLRARSLSAKRKPSRVARMAFNLSVASSVMSGP